MTKTGGTIKSVVRSGASGDSVTIEIHYPDPEPEGETVFYRSPAPPGAHTIADAYVNLLEANVGKTADVTVTNGAVSGVKVR